MKRLCLALTLTLLPLAGSYAQEPSPTPSVSGPAPGAEAGGRKERRHARMENLTPEEQQKIKAARRAAMDDPEVKAAQATRSTDRKGFRKTMMAAMLRKDPSVGPILEKMRDERKKEKIF